MSALIGYFTLAVALVSAVLSSIVTIVLCPLQLVTIVLTLVLSALQFGWAFLQNPRSIIILGLLLLGYFVLGPIGVDQTTVIIEAINILFECAFQVAYEFVYKVFGVNWLGFWNYTLPVLNNAIAYIGVHWNMFYADVIVQIQCIIDLGNFAIVIALPYTIWTKLVSPLFWIFSTTPPQNRAEPLLGIIENYYYPRDKNSAVIPSFQYSPDFGAQGAPSLPNSNLEFAATDFYNQAAVIVDDIGTLFVTIVRDIGEPGRRFIPGFYRGINDKENYWRAVADIVTRTVELGTLTSLWPRTPGTYQQNNRAAFVKYVARLMRSAAGLFSYVSLLLVDATTTRRPLVATFETCYPQSGLDELLRGVPLIDLILASINGQFDNLLILKANLRFCEFGKFVAATRPAAASQCPGLAKSSYIATCPVWSTSTDIPTIAERIDYTDFARRRLLSFIENLLGFGVITNNPFTGLIGRLNKFLIFIGLTFDFVVLDTAYVVNSFTQPTLCALDLVILKAFTEDLPGVIIAFIDFIFDVSCADTVIGTVNDNNIFWCLLAGFGKGVGGFFEDFACIFQDIGDVPFVTAPVEFTFCDRRKRSIDARTYFSERRDMTYKEKAYLYAMYYASQTRKTFREAHHCFTDSDSPFVRCESLCAAQPCMRDALDCLHNRLPESNVWKDLLRAPQAGETAYTRNTIVVLTMGVDLLRGCSDTTLSQMHSSAAATVAVVRDAMFRYFVFAHNYMPTYQRCMEAAQDATAKGVDAQTVDRDYLLCIGLKPASSPSQQPQHSPTDAPSGVVLHGTAPQTANETSASFDVWRSTLLAHGIDSTSTACGAVLHKHGLVLDEASEVESLHVDHLSYRVCAMAQAIGARAIASGGSVRKLSDFIGAATAVGALIDSTSQFSEKDYGMMLSGMPREMAAIPLQLALTEAPSSLVAQLSNMFSPGHLVKPLLSTEGTESQTEDEKLRANEEFLRKMAVYEVHHAASVLYALFNHMADVYDDVANRADLSPSEKDAATEQMFARVLAVAATKSTRAKAAVDELDKKLYTMYKEAELQNEPVSAGKVFAAMGASFYWVDRLMTTDNPVTSSAMDAVFADKEPPAPGTSVVEAFIDATRREQYSDGAIMLGLRPLDTPMSGMVAQLNGALVPSSAAQEGFNIVELSRIADGLEAYLHGKHTRIETLRYSQQSAAALNALKILNDELRAHYYGDTVAGRVGALVFQASRLSLRVVWNIVNNRLRVESLGSTQAAHVAIDAITNGESDDLAKWLRGERGYIVGVGYVSREAYDEYMKMEDETRRVFMRGYGWSLENEDLHRLYFASTRSESLKRVESLVPPPRLMLEGHKRSALYRDRLKQRLSRIGFGHRSRFLVRHGLHDDEMLHHVAGPNWVHYEAALQANTSEARQRYSVMAAGSSNEFWIELWDETIATLGGPATFVSDTIDSFEQIAIDIWDFIVDNLFDFLDTQYNTFLTVATCTGPSDYRLSGTTPYRLGCVPFLPERLFQWWQPFPAATLPLDPALGFFNAFEGPGYIQWPPDMLAVGGDCPAPLNPALFPPSTVTVFENPSDFFDTFTFTDACVPGGQSFRPLCPVCDYCAREWKSAREFGQTTGWDNIKVWDASLRYLLNNPFAQTGGYLFVIACFLLWEFGAFLPVVGSGGAIAFVVIAIFSEFFFVQMPGRFALTVLTLIAITTISSAVSYGVFAFYVYAMFFPYALGRAYPSIVQTLLDFISSTLLPGPIAIFIIDVLDGFPFKTTLQTVPLIGNLFDTAPFVPVRADLVLFMTRDPTFSEVFYSIVSFRNFIDLVVLAIPYALAIGLLGLAAVVLFQCLLRVALEFFALYIRFRDFLLRRRVSSLEGNVEETRQEFTDMLAMLRQDTQEQMEQYMAEIRVLAVSAQKTKGAVSDVRRRQRKQEQKADN